VHQAVHDYGYKVLVTAPSNVAVDNILSRLLVAMDQNAKALNRRSRKANPSSHRRGRLSVVRLGHPARLQPAILPYCLEALVQSAEGTEIVQDVRAELQSHLATLRGPKYSTRGGRVDKRLAYAEVKVLRKELQSREEGVVTTILQQAHVVLATCVGAAHKLLQDLQFDLVVIDEAAQALEAACWIPALQARTKLVLAGGTYFCLCVHVGGAAGVGLVIQALHGIDWISPLSGMSHACAVVKYS
jgi:superfamily I DNA and/or RNA helicase